MVPGLLGFSLVLELLVGYFALHLLFPNTEKRWLAVALLLFVLVATTDLSTGRWVELFSGNIDFLWREVLDNFGFH